MKTLSGQHKKNLFIGLILVSVAFVCVIGIFYFMINAQRVQFGEIAALNERVASLDSERDVLERLTGDLEQKVGSSIALEKILKEADKVYGDTEKDRREGHLWIDHASATFVVTLGALNGLMPGSHLTVYDGASKIGSVIVETPLDVISSVQPVDKTLAQFTNDYYRVVFEE